MTVRRTFCVRPRIRASLICPQVVRPAITVHQELQRGPFKDLLVGLVHGDMKEEEKEAAMQAFKSGETQARGSAWARGRGSGRQRVFTCAFPFALTLCLALAGSRRHQGCGGWGRRPRG